MTTKVLEALRLIARTSGLDSNDDAVMRELAAGQLPADEAYARLTDEARATVGQTLALTRS